MNTAQHRWILAVAVCLLLGIFPAAAQEPTETPLDGTPAATATPTETQASPTPAPPTFTPTSTPVVPSWVTTWREEVLYPQAVRFTMTIDRPLDQILALELTINAPGEAQPRTFSPEPDEIATLTARTFTEMVFLWVIPPNNPLPFNAEVDYFWEVTVAQLGSAVLPGVFAYSDPAVRWVQDQDPNERVSLIYPEGQVDVELLRRTVQGVYTLLARNTETSPELRLVVYSDDFPFDPCHENDAGEQVIVGPVSGTELACNPQVIENILRDLNYDPFPLPSVSRSTVTDALLRYMVAEFYAPSWAGRDVPAWFQTGMTYFYLPGEKFYLLDAVRSASRTRYTFTFDEMSARDETNPVLWDAQAYTMVLYIARQIGVAQLFEFAGTAGDGEAFAESFADVVNMPLTGLLPNWNNWIFTGVAASDSSLQLYEGPTPVPSPTQTVTPFPASVTPTPTFTVTPTFTHTPVGFAFTATPLPSRTPTVTLTPAPPTITPRPPRSFEDLTPQPTQPTNGSPLDDLDTDVVLVVGTVAVALFLLAVWLLFGRRSRR